MTADNTQNMLLYAVDGGAIILFVAACSMGPTNSGTTGRKPATVPASAKTTYLKKHRPARTPFKF
jgi:hypothetical protein